MSSTFSAYLQQDLFQPPSGCLYNITGVKCLSFSFYFFFYFCGWILYFLNGKKILQTTFTELRTQSTEYCHTTLWYKSLNTQLVAVAIWITFWNDFLLYTYIQNWTYLQDRSEVDLFIFHDFRRIFPISVTNCIIYCYAAFIQADVCSIAWPCNELFESEMSEKKVRQNWKETQV